MGITFCLVEVKEMNLIYYLTKTSSQYEPASGFALAEDERYETQELE